MSIENGSTAVNTPYWLHPVVGIDHDGLPYVADYMGYPLDRAEVLHIQKVVNQYLEQHTDEWPTERYPDPSAGTFKLSKPVTKAGIIYLLSGNGHFKIGLSTNFKKRMVSYLRLPFEVTLIHTIETSDIDALEKYWHRRFTDKRGNGEWFSLTPEDVAEFCAQDTMEVPL